MVTHQLGYVIAGQAVDNHMIVFHHQGVIAGSAGQFGVSYAEVGRRFYIGSVHFTRIAGAFLQVSHLRGPDGELRNLVTAERHHWDRLSGKQKTLVEGASYPFTAPELSSPSLGRYVEPAVVVGIVVNWTSVK